MGGACLYHLAQLSAIVRPGETVLDLGCGSGALLCALARLHPRNKFIGVDLSLEMLDRARKAVEDRRASNLSFIHSDMTNLTLFER